MSSTKRTFRRFDQSTLSDSKNGIYAIIIFDPDEKSGFKSLFSWKSKETNSDYVEGVICTDPNLDYKLIRNDPNKVEKLKQEGVILHTIHGSWLFEMFIDQERIWKLEDIVPYKVVPKDDALLSDSRFWEDL